MTPQITLRNADNTRRQAAFVRLWEAERPRIWRLTARLSGSGDAADDLTQEIGVRALGAFDSFRGASSGSTWLFRIAVNVILRWRERNSRTATQDLTQMPERTAAASLEGQVVAASEAERIRRAADTLPDELRTPLLLHAWEGMKYREIADALEIPLGTVMSRLSAARKRLRKILGDGEENDGL